jgi:hypothetical protein
MPDNFTCQGAVTLIFHWLLKDSKVLTINLLTKDLKSWQHTLSFPYLQYIIKLN